MLFKQRYLFYTASCCTENNKNSEETIFRVVHSNTSSFLLLLFAIQLGRTLLWDVNHTTQYTPFSIMRFDFYGSIEISVLCIISYDTDITAALPIHQYYPEVIFTTGVLNSQSQLRLVCGTHCDYNNDVHTNKNG